MWAQFMVCWGFFVVFFFVTVVLFFIFVKVSFMLRLVALSAFVSCGAAGHSDFV